MTSAALDACLCLLLVSAAAVTVASVPAKDSSEMDRADTVAESLAVETAEVTYTLSPVEGRRANASPEYDRTAHGSLASLLARAAVRTVQIDGEPLTRTNEGFASAVRRTARERLPERTQVVVAFRPFPGAHIGRELRVGPTPPARADVHAATVRASSAVETVDEPKAVATTGGFDSVGDAVAAELVGGLFPPEQGRLGLAGDAPVNRLVTHRYARASEEYGVSTREPIERGDVREANSRLTAAMGDRLAADLRERFASPTAAADSLRIDAVKLSIRTWSP